MSLLQVKNVSKQFGGLTANQDVSFTVEKAQVVGLTERVAELAASNAALTDAIGRLSPPASAGR